MKPKLIEILKKLQISSGGLDSNKTREKYLKEHDLYNDIMYYSKELETDSLNERIYFIVNDLSIEDTKCKNPNCQNKAKYNNYLKGYRDTCSIECGSRYRDIKTIEKRRIAYKEKAEKKYPNKTFDFSGYTNIDSNVKVTCENGHTELMSYSDIRYKCLCSICTQDENYKEFVEKANKKHNFKYTYELSSDPKKVIINCKEHGKTEMYRANHLGGTGCRRCSNRVIYNKENLVQYIKDYDLKVDVLGEYKSSKSDILCRCQICNKEFISSSNSIVNSKPGCPTCSKNMITEDVFIEKMKEYDDIEYISGYTVQSSKCKFKCKIHDLEFEQQPRLLFKGLKGCPKCQYGSKSRAELEIFEYIEQITSDAEKVESGNRTILEGKELDIYVPEHKFAIEYNGLMFHSSGLYQNGRIKNTPKNFHLDKTELCEQKGIQLFHIFENEWLDPVKQEIWKSIINEKLGIHKIIENGEELEIKYSTLEETFLFLENNHLYGSCKFSKDIVNIGLYKEQVLLSIITFKEIEDDVYEILRYATKLNYTIINSIKEIIYFFEETHKPKKIIKNEDRRWEYSNENYKELGFDFIHNSKPNCYYFEEGSLVLEEENAFNTFLSSYRKIYDSGNKVFIKEYNKDYNFKQTYSILDKRTKMTPKDNSNLLPEDLKNIQEIQDFLDENQIDYKRTSQTMFCMYYGNPDGKRSYEIEYIPSHLYPTAYPKYNIKGVKKDYFYKRSKEAEDNNSFKCYVKDYEWEDDRKREVLKSYWIYAAQKITERYYARECEVRKVQTPEGRAFESVNCFYGKRGASLSLGLYTKKEKYGIPAGTLIMIYTFGKNFFGKDNSIEVLRVGTKRFAQVIGGASKLLKFFIKNHSTVEMAGKEVPVQKIKFYSDYDHNIGNSMEELGFEFVSYSKGGFMNYWTEERITKGREPTRHKWVMEQMQKGKVVAVPNAGVKTFVMDAQKERAKMGIKEKKIHSLEDDF